MDANNDIEVNIRPDIEAEALRVLRDVPEIVITAELGPEQHADAVVHSAGTQTPVAVEVRARVNSANVHRVIHRAQQLTMPLIVVAREMTGAARELLTAEGIGTIDGLGNVRLTLPGLLMRVDGARRAPRARTPSRLSGKAALIAQALLLEPKRIWHLSELSDRAGVSPALAYRVMQRLAEDGIVTASGSGPAKTRRLAEPTALLDLWVEEHHEKHLRHPAFLLASAAKDPAEAVCRALDAFGTDYALTGAAAAARIAPFVTSIPVVHVWLDAAADPAATCQRLGAQPVETGPNVVLRQGSDNAPLAFRTQRDGIWSANVFRLYLDLRHDPRRGLEQAEHLRSELIGF